MYCIVHDLGNMIQDMVLHYQINVLDVITTMNIVLTNGSYNTCSDLNTDGAINVLDVVALVNLILSSEN